MAATVHKAALEAPQHVLDLLERLHKLSLDQEDKLRAPDGYYNTAREMHQQGSDQAKANRDEVMRDNLIRALGSLNVVEAGTSFGVSTIYLALAVGQNAKLAGKQAGSAKVIATENELSKAERARAIWKEAGDSVEPWIELREGDLTQTLKSHMLKIDFVLFDIWTPMVLPTLDVLEPHFRAGTVLIVDNTVFSQQGYKAFFARVKAPDSKYKTLTLPYSGGLEMITYWP